MPTVYKYQSITERSLQNLAQRKLWASLPAAFNDPFEFRVSRNAIIKFFEPFVRSGLHNLQHLTEEEIIELLSRQIEEQLQKFGVTCFTEDPANILMWSHYADCHRGMCLGFELNEEQFLGGMHPVNYLNDYPSPDFSLGWHMEGLGKILTTKSRHWAYEKELRRIIVSGQGLYSYPGRLSTVIFGCRCDSTDQEAVREILTSESEVHYYYARLSPNFYLIHLEEVEPKTVGKSVPLT